MFKTSGQSGTLLTRRSRTLALGAAVALPLLANTRPAFAHAEHDMGPDLTIYTGEFYFREDGKEENAPITLVSGRPHLIQFINEGWLDHEIHFGRGPDMEERHYAENLFGPSMMQSGQRRHMAHGMMGVHLPPRPDDDDAPLPTATMHIWIPAGAEGEWEVGCFIPEHYEAGQHAVVKVVADTA
ncbi:MAG: hypothetical protein RLQ25_11655 [Alphaproteobacteria bacterium]